MKTKHTISSMLIVAVLLGAVSITAQGILIKQRSGIIINIPYAELDSISTYNSDDTPVEVEGVKTFEVKGVTFNMVFVEGGSFEMGATPEQSNGYTTYTREYPVHTVTLSDYYIGQTEVTQELWFAVMNASPSVSYNWTSEYGLGDKYPAYTVSYTECEEFISKLNNITDATFRMPTEAEWEYAARGGKKSKDYIFSGSNDEYEVAWSIHCSPRRTHEVRTLVPNELGIYDMSGNVWEWCSDWFDFDYYSNSTQTNPPGPTTGTYRVMRGGSWFHGSCECRVAYRSYENQDEQRAYYGLRLAL